MHRRVMTAMLCLLLAVSVSAYTGSYLVSPAASPGPGSTTPYQFKIDTTASNPQVFEVDGSYIKRVTVATHSGQKGNLVVLEESQGGQNTWSFNVQNKINDDLDYAIIEFWAPDQESIEVWHEHKPDPPYLEVASKVSPPESDGNGNILWSITVQSFSSFYLEPPRLNLTVPWSAIGLLVLICAVACFLVERR